MVGVGPKRLTREAEPGKVGSHVWRRRKAVYRGQPELVKVTADGGPQTAPDGAGTVVRVDPHRLGVEHRDETPEADDLTVVLGDEVVGGAWGGDAVQPLVPVE